MRPHKRKRILAATCILCMAWGPGSVLRAYPPDPDNAALVYYQAFLLLVPLESEQKEAVAEFSRGERELTDEIRETVGQFRSAIEYSLTASQMRTCSWGLRLSLGFNASLPHLAQLRSLSRVLLADARIRAADGAWREAFERCLAVKRIGKHVGDDVIISMLVAGSLDGAANEVIGDLLGAMPADEEMLAWLKSELATLSSDPLTAGRTLEYEREVAMETMRPENRELLIHVFEGMGTQITPKQVAQVDEQLLARNRDHYDRFITSIQTILSTPGTYEERYQKLNRLVARMEESASDEDSTIAAALAPRFDSVFSRQALIEASANATQAAVEIYRVRARTGRLPADLPSDLPKDPFSGRDFEYERTDSGFVLRCGGKDLSKDTVHEYVFSVN